MNQEGVEGEEGEGGWQAAGPTPPPAALHTKPRMMQSWSGAAGGLEETWAPWWAAWQTLGTCGCLTLNSQPQCGSFMWLLAYS